MENRKVGVLSKLKKETYMTARYQTLIEKWQYALFEEEKSQMTIAKYVRDVSHLIEYLQGKELTKEGLIHYKAELLQSNYTPSSINSMLSAINNFLEYIRRPDLKLKRLKTQKELFCNEKKQLTKAEYRRLFAVAKDNRRLQLIMETLASTGIRISELKYFTVERVKAGEINVKCKNKIRKIFIPHKLCRMLRKYARQRGITRGMIFVTRTGKPLDRSNIWKELKQLGDKAKVELSKIYPHALRKLFARTYYNMERDVAKLADLLGHSSVDTTRIYIMSTGQEHKKSLEQLGLLIS